MHFPLGILFHSIKPVAADYVKRMPRRQLDPSTQGSALAAAGFVYFLLALSFACWVSRMDPVPPDVLQQGPLLAPRLQHVGCPLTIQISFHP